MASSQGSQATLGMDATTTFDGASEPYEFLREDLKAVQQVLRSEGISGTRSRRHERTTDGQIDVSGSITMNPSPTELNSLLPRILGSAEATDVFNPAETLPEFSVMIDRVAKVFQYDGCKISRAIFRGSSNGLLELTVEILGKTETITAAGSFPAISVDTDPVYAFRQGVITLEGSAREFDDFELVVDNLLAARFMNSQTANDISPQDRAVTLRLSTPYTSSEVDLLANPLVASDTGDAAATLVFTNGGRSLTFTFGNLEATPESPVVPGKSEILLPLSYQAFKTGSTEDLVVTNDSTA